MNVVLASLTVGLFWLCVLVARALGRDASYSLAALGFARPRVGLLAGAGLGVAVGVGTLIVSAILNPLSVLVLERLGYPTGSRVQQPFMQGLEGWVRESPQLAVPVIVFTVVIFGPFVEELVFRGAIFGGLYRLARAVPRAFGARKDPAGAVRKTAFVLSALASSVFFALLHLEPVLLPALLVLAFALCVLYARTGSLLPPFLAHATFNSFATTFIILSGLGVLELPV